MKSTAPKIHICGGGAQLSTNTLHDRRVDQILRRRLALGAVVAHTGSAGLELGQCVAVDDAVELGMTERAERLAVGRDEQLAADAGPSTIVASATGCWAAECAPASSAS